METQTQERAKSEAKAMPIAKEIPGVTFKNGVAFLNNRTLFDTIRRVVGGFGFFKPEIIQLIEVFSFGDYGQRDWLVELKGKVADLPKTFRFYGEYGQIEDEWNVQIPMEQLLLIAGFSPNVDEDDKETIKKYIRVK